MLEYIEKFVNGVKFETPPECGGQAVEVSYGFASDGETVVIERTRYPEGDTRYMVGIVDDCNWLETYCSANGAPPVLCNIPIAEYLNCD